MKTFEQWYDGWKNSGLDEVINDVFDKDPESIDYKIAELSAWMAVCRREGLFYMDRQVKRFWELCGYVTTRDGGRALLCQAPVLGSETKGVKTEKPY